MHGFQLTMAVFAVVSVLMFWTTFATTTERVTPPPAQRTNVREELGELFRNRPWVILLIASVLSTTFIALRSGSTLFFFKYVVGDDGSPMLFGLDRSTVFLSSGALSMMIGTALMGTVARRIDKKFAAAGLSAITGLCFLAFYLLPRDQFALMVAVNALGNLCMGPTSALTWALYGDVADFGEWRFGRRSTALVYSASLFAIKTGMLLGGFLVPLMLDQFGFIPNATQSASAIAGITLAFSVLPGTIALLKAAALMTYPLDQRQVDEIELALATRCASGAITAVA